MLRLYALSVNGSTQLESVKFCPVVVHLRVRPPRDHRDERVKFLCEAGKNIVPHKRGHEQTGTGPIIDNGANVLKIFIVLTDVPCKLYTLDLCKNPSRPRVSHICISAMRRVRLAGRTLNKHPWCC